MLKRSNSRTTRRSQANETSPQIPQNATVLKAIHPSKQSTRPIEKPLLASAPIPTSTSGNTSKLLTAANSSTQGAFFLPSSEFFVVDKDSLVLSESDIFQTNNLATKTSQHTNHNNSHSQRHVHHQNYSHNLDDSESADLYNYPSFDDHEKENDYRSSGKNNNDVNSRYSDLLSRAIENNNNSNGALLLKNQMKRPIPPINIATRPVQGSHNSHSHHNHHNSHHHSNHHHPQSNHRSSTAGNHHVYSPSAVSTPQTPQQLDKGLRHFSAKVCAKVEEKGVTTYNEVADDLVQEIGLEMGKCDHKNIRRRVYDALNVLMAIDIIRKEKKEIRWLGLPNEAADDFRSLEAERAALLERNAEKSRNLREVLRRCISLKNLIDRNSGSDLSTSSTPSDKLPLPFILISAARDCHVHCEMLEDRTQYFFEFNTAFQINEDIELMRLMGLDTARIEKIKSFFPKELVAQVLMLSLNSTTTNSTTRNSSNSNSMKSSSTNALADMAAVNNSVFAPMMNNENLNLGELDSFSSTTSSLSSSLSLTSSP
jgi:hypothetical protein